MQNVYTHVYILSWSVYIAYRHKIKKRLLAKKRSNRGHLRCSWPKCQAIYIRQYNILLPIQMECESCLERRSERGLIFRIKHGPF